MAKQPARKNTKATNNGSRNGRVIWAVVVLLVVVTAGLFFRPRPTTPPPLVATTAKKPVYLPAEFGPQDNLLLGGFQLAELFPDILTSIVEAVPNDIRIRIMVGSATERASVEAVMTDAKLLPTNVDFIELPIITMWARDFGPLVVADGEGQRQIRDFYYRERRGNSADDDVPIHLAQAMNLPLETSPTLLEGGDFICNGLGLCLLSTRVVNRNAHYLDLTAEQTVNDVADRLGFDDISLVHALQGESTGHADMFCAFLQADLVVIGQYEATVDSLNAAQLDDLARSLTARATRAGPLQVVRLPMPNHDDGVWRTYTNVVFANEVLLVPLYPDYCPELDVVALATYRRLLPDRRVVGIDASQLIRMNGALRCITMNVPSGVPFGAN